MKSIILFLVVVAASSMANGYVIKPKGVSLVGKVSGAKNRLWQPDRAINMGSGRVAVRLLTSEDSCRERKDCTYTVAWSANDGESFNTEESVTDFCGSQGVKVNNVLHCVDLKKGLVKGATLPDGVPEGSVLIYSHVGFNVDLPGMLSRAKFSRQDLSDTSILATFDKPKSEEKLPLAVSAIGDQIIFFEDKDLYFRNVELVLANSTAVHALYESQDGFKWTFVSFIPIDFGIESALMRFGDTKVFIISGRRGNYTQAESIYLGLKWEKIANASFTTLMYTYSSPFRTSIYTGLKGQPGVYAAAQGSKKGSEKPINVADLHNRMVKKSETKSDYDLAPAGTKNFTKSFMETELFECTSEPFNVEGDAGCESSSVTTVASSSNGTVIIFYDQLSKGYGSGGTGGVYALRLLLNETKEEKEWDDRVKAEAKKAEEDQQRQEARKKADKEAEKRRRQERREKKRQDKERRNKYTELDQPNVDRAAEEKVLDGETVVIREVDAAWVDLEKDMF